MDDFDRKHLQEWAEFTLHDDERDMIVGRIVRFVAEYPECITRGDSWSEIRALADREAAR